MTFRGLFLSPRGRISRRQWWIGAILLVVVEIGCLLLVLPLLGLSAEELRALPSIDPQARAQVLLEAYQHVAWGSLAIFALIAYPAYCLSLKRRHDRNQDGRDVYLALAVSALPLLMEALGLAYSIGEVDGAPWPTPGLTYLLAGAVALCFGVYMLVVLGFLKGGAGPNSYGPDPRAAADFPTEGPDRA